MGWTRGITTHTTVWLIRAPSGGPTPNKLSSVHKFKLHFCNIRYTILAYPFLQFFVAVSSGLLSEYCHTTMYLLLSVFSIKSLLPFSAPLLPSILLSFFCASNNIVFWLISFLICFYLPIILYFIFSLYLLLTSYFAFPTYLPVWNSWTALHYTHSL